jgi:hypothetical protein
VEPWYLFLCYHFCCYYLLSLPCGEKALYIPGVWTVCIDNTLFVLLCDDNDDEDEDAGNRRSYCKMVKYIPGVG